jgi:hypothetical protein
MLDDIRQGYYGGATDMYKPAGDNIYTYDVNSLYPYATFPMLKPMPLEFIRYHDEISDMDTFFGYILAEITCPKDMKIPLLPFRNKDTNEVLYPTGT